MTAALSRATGQHPGECKRCHGFGDTPATAPVIVREYGKLRTTYRGSGCPDCLGTGRVTSATLTGAKIKDALMMQTPDGAAVLIHRGVPRVYLAGSAFARAQTCPRSLILAEAVLDRKLPEFLADPFGDGA